MTASSETSWRWERGRGAAVGGSGGIPRSNQLPFHLDDHSRGEAELWDGWMLNFGACVCASSTSFTVPPPHHPCRHPRRRPQVLRQLGADSQLDAFRLEYEKVFRALKKSHDNERRLVKRCRELNAEVVGGAAKVAAALALSDADQGTIAALKKEIENSWRMVDSSHEKALWQGCRGVAGGETSGAEACLWQGEPMHKLSCMPSPLLCSSPSQRPHPVPTHHPQELKFTEQVAALKLEISGLTQLLEAGAAVGLGEEADLEELIRQKGALAAERDAQVGGGPGVRGWEVCVCVGVCCAAFAACAV